MPLVRPHLKVAANKPLPKRALTRDFPSVNKFQGLQNLSGRSGGRAGDFVVSAAAADRPSLSGVEVEPEGLSELSPAQGRYRCPSDHRDSHDDCWPRTGNPHRSVLEASGSNLETLPRLRTPRWWQHHQRRHPAAQRGPQHNPAGNQNLTSWPKSG